MRASGRLMDMLTGYVSAHQHPFNVFIHMLGIPMITFGVLIATAWLEFTIAGVTVTGAHVLLVGFTLFYLTLDVLFALVFLVLGWLLLIPAVKIAALPFGQSAAIAAACFFGGYAAQFAGHAVEKSMPVLVRHPVQANLAAPFFTVVELFKMLGLRDDLFDEVQRRVAERRADSDR